MDQVRQEGSVLNIYDWAEWWPEELFTDFSREFGVKIVRDHFASTDEMETKFKLNPKAGYDLVLGSGPNNVMKMIPMGLIRKLNPDWLPNVNAYLRDEFKSTPFDPSGAYNVPSALYLVSVTYNAKYVDPDDPLLGSWRLLFEGKATRAGSP